MYWRIRESFVQSTAVFEVDDFLAVVVLAPKLFQGLLMCASRGLVAGLVRIAHIVIILGL